MANGFGDELKRRLPEIVLGILAARQGPRALAGFQGSVQKSRQQQQQLAMQQQERADVLARQAQLDDERRSQQAAVEARAQRDDTRADEQQNLLHRNSLLSALTNYDSDPAALARFYGVPEGEAAALAAPILNAKDKRAAKEFIEALDPKKRPELAGYFQNEQGLADLDNTTLTEWRGKPSVKIGQIRQWAQEPVIPPRLAKPDVPTPGSFEDFTTAPPERQAKIAADRKAYMQADDRPADPVLGELRQLRLEQAKAGQGAAPTLPPATQRRVDMKTRAFDAQPVVKRIQTMAESVQFAGGLNPNTTNPADDQALIYAFAKAMDPESVVREGEYATVQKYAQSWAESFGFNAARIFSNTTFLTPQARKNMKATIRARFEAARPQYENLRQSYATQIGRITNQGDGDSYLVDYAAAFPDGEQPAAGATGSGAGATYDEYLKSRGQR